MTAVDGEPSAGRMLVRLHPLIRLVLRHGAGLDDKQRAAILRKTLLWCRGLVEREPHLAPASVSTAVHTRLRQIMADPKPAGEKPQEKDVEESSKKSEESPPESSPRVSDDGAAADDLLRELGDIEARRVAAVHQLLDSLDGLHGAVLKLAVGDGLDDVEIAARVGVASDQVGRIGADALRELEDAWLSGDPAAGRLSQSPPEEDALFFHYIAYVRGKLDPDRVNLTESHAFRYIRNGARLAALQAVLDRIRAGEWKPKARPAGAKRSPFAVAAGGSAAVIVVGVLTVLVALSSVGRDELRATVAEMSILQPAPLPSGLTLPDGSRHAEALDRAVAAYTRGDFAEASERWEELYDGGARIPDLGLYLGVSQFLSGDSRKAVQTLARQVSAGAHGVAYHFYRAQALLVLGRVEEAREELRAVLSSGDSVYRKDAERQLTTLLTPQPSR